MLDYNNTQLKFSERNSLFVTNNMAKYNNEVVSCTNLFCYCYVGGRRQHWVSHVEVSVVES